MPVSELNEDPDPPAVVLPVDAPVGDKDAPVNEKGDEPLQHHEEEMQEAEFSQLDGLTLFHKLGALAIIVAVCAVFVRITSRARSESSAGYERSLA